MSDTEDHSLDNARKRAQQEASKANCIAISNTKLAASLDSLGFHSDCSPTENVSTGKVVREFMFQPRSEDEVFKNMGLNIADARLWEDGVLEKQSPAHPLCLCMYAQHNYDRVLDMHKGAVMNLRSIPDKQFTKYRRCSQPDPETHFSPELIKLSNLALAASLAVVGIPVLRIFGGEGGREYYLPRFGYALHRADGTQYLEDAQELVKLSPIPLDPWRLALAETNPLHPVVLGYNALRSRIVLRDLLMKKKPRLLAEDGGLTAVVTPNYTGRVMEKIAKRMGAPPL